MGKMKEPLARKLLKHILMTYLIVVISVNAVLMIYQYYHTKDLIIRDLISAQAIFGKGLGEASWNFDETSIQAIIKGMLEHPSFTGVSVTGNDGKQLGAGGVFMTRSGRYATFKEGISVDPNEPPLLLDPKKEHLSGIFSRTFPIEYVSQDNGRKHAVGNAAVFSTREIVMEQIKGGYWLLFVNTVIVGVALCIMFLWVSRKYLLNPISALTRAVSSLDPKRLDPQEAGVKTSAQEELAVMEKAFPNEVGILAGTFNHMIDDLKRHIHELAAATAAEERMQSRLEIADAIQTSLRKVIGEVLGGGKLDYSFEWLLPHMRREDHKKGHIIFNKGDAADRMFYLKTGVLRLVEINATIEAGNLIGETGILSPLKQRTMSVVCETDAELYVMNEKEALQFFYEDPSVVFKLIQITIKRALENLKSTVAEKERIEADLRIAHEIQKSMLPRIFPAFPDNEEFDIFASMEPAKEVGGDFYDFFLINDNKLCFIVGDVSGKGVPAALFMMITKILLKTEALRDLPPSQVLLNVNNIIAQDNETSMFVTILCAMLDLETGELEIGNAGHNPPLLCKAGGDFEFIQIPKCFVLGPMEDTPFTSLRLTLKPGDTVFFYTDGVTEACNHNAELFSEDRLRTTLSRLNACDPMEIVDSIGVAIEDFVRDEPQSDDITMVTLRFTGR